ncbi:MAG: hypothetical protein Q8K36_01535, partial [Alphaproteobacteria bacterium]|nr:hypothetical protein [Alphaproteobacteria bacterium]
MKLKTLVMLGMLSGAGACVLASDAPENAAPAAASAASMEDASMAHASHDSPLPPEMQLYLTEMGHTLLGQVMRGEPVVRDGLFDAFANLNDKNYLYAPRCANLEPSLWVRGTMKLVRKADTQADTFRNDYLMSIICMSWALDNLAIQKNQGFSRGSFTLIDSEHKFANYLKGYVSLVTGSAHPETLPYLQTPNNFAYRREPTLGGSSHHQHHSPDSQFGIDARFSSSHGVLRLLPHGHTHILFGKLQYNDDHPSLTFLKFEPVGLGNIACALAHALNFGHSGTVDGDARREKDLPKEAVVKFKELMPSVEMPKSVWEMFAQ